MITFDLQCGQGHVFEGWFDSHSSFEEQLQQELVRCPLCEDAQVRRVLSPVALKRAPMVPAKTDEALNYQALAHQVVEYIQKNSEDVGSRFAAEALKIHYGVTEKRSIRGSATEEEEKTLKKEGVDFIKVPFPVTEDKKAN